MPQTADAVTDHRSPPFCYQTLDALAAIRAYFTGAKLATALAVYVTFTEVANAKGGAAARGGFKATRKEIAKLAGVSVDTLDRYAATFEEIGVIEVEREKVGEVNLPNRWALTDPSTPGRTDAATLAAPVRHIRAGSLPVEEVRGKEVGVSYDTPARDDLTSPPKLHKIDGQDIAFNALRDICGINPRDANRAREVAVGLNGGGPRAGIKVGIRALAWEEIVEGHFGGDYLEASEVIEIDPPRFEKAVVAMIQRRAKQYESAMPGAALTPIALAKWWLSVEGLSAGNGKGGMSAADMAAYSRG